MPFNRVDLPHEVNSQLQFYESAINISTATWTPSAGAALADVTVDANYDGAGKVRYNIGAINTYYDLTYNGSLTLKPGIYKLELEFDARNATCNLQESHDGGTTWTTIGTYAQNAEPVDLICVQLRGQLFPSVLTTYKFRVHFKSSSVTSYALNIGVRGIIINGISQN